MRPGEPTEQKEQKEQKDNERYMTVTVRAIGLAYIVVLLVFTLAWLR